MSISVIGFRRPVSTLASLFGSGSGSSHDDMHTQEISSRAFS